MRSADAASIAGGAAIAVAGVCRTLGKGEGDVPPPGTGTGVGGGGGSD
jgi:hypothetical protein